MSTSKTRPNDRQSACASAQAANPTTVARSRVILAAAGL